MNKDFDYDQLDPGIRKVVRFLHEHNFDTTDSGDGETKTDMPCAMEMPNVAIVVASQFDLIDEADRLLWLLKRHLSERVLDEIHIEASYDPMDGSCILLLLRLHDRMLPW